MTYQDIADWAEKNVPMGLAGGSFTKWLSMIDNEFLQSGHFLPHTEVDPLLEKRFLKHHEKLEPSEEAPQEPQAPKGNIGKRLSERFDRLPEGTEFTPKQISQYTGFNRNTVRRELQEFVAEGRLQRVSKGRYRVV